MAEAFKTWVAVGPQDAGQAAAHAPVAWLIYRVVDGRLGRMRLGRMNTAVQPRGGLLGLTGTLPEDGPGRAVQDIFVECTRRGFQGVLLDLDAGCPREAALRLSAQLEQRGLLQFAPAALATGRGRVIIGSALSGGSFDEMLAAAGTRYGAQSLCLEIVRMCHDFTMPAINPQGRALKAGELRAIRQQHGGASYFSHEMMCRYFSYRAQDGRAHFVLFDDLETARGKLERARAAGFCGGFVLRREWGDGVRHLIG